MIFRYLKHIVWYDVVLRGLNYILFPVAYLIRPEKGFLKIFISYDSLYGDKYFNPDQEKTLWWAYKWNMRNPLRDYYYSHKITGDEYDHKGWATIQKGRADGGTMWRTVKTKDADGHYMDKHGEYIDYQRSILGKQRITFWINGEKYFRYSGVVPRRIWKNLYWFVEYKFGFENVNWAIQFKPFKFKRFNGGKICYKRIEL
jgi:hypothetical protein